MEMPDRVRELRKNHLKLSQTAFGEKLGVSRSVINNIESGVLARPDQKLSLIKLMCKEFSVREEWLLDGKEPMFAEPDTFSLDEFVRSNGATDFEIEFMKSYFTIDPELRQQLLSHFKQRLLRFEPTISEQNQEDIEDADFKAAAKKAIDQFSAEIFDTREFQTPTSEPKEFSNSG